MASFFPLTLVVCCWLGNNLSSTPAPFGKKKACNPRFVSWAGLLLQQMLAGLPFCSVFVSCVCVRTAGGYRENER